MEVLETVVTKVKNSAELVSILHGRTGPDSPSTKEAMLLASFVAAIPGLPLLYLRIRTEISAGPELEATAYRLNIVPAGSAGCEEAVVEQVFQNLTRLRLGW